MHAKKKTFTDKEQCAIKQEVYQTALQMNSAFLGELSTIEIEDAVNLANKHNLIDPTIGFGNHILTTPLLKDEVLQHFEIVLEAALKFEAQFIGVWVNPSQGVSREDSLGTLAENLRHMIPVCNEHDLKIALEFEKGCPLDNYREAVDFISDTGLSVYLTCDTYHLNNDGTEPYAAVLAMKEYLGDVHVSGSHRDEPGAVSSILRLLQKV